MSAHNTTQSPQEDRGFFGQPKGLFTLFFTEFWERFSYYGMRAILLFYMYYEISKGGLGMDATVASSIMAIYGSLIYMSGIIGGWISDRLLGASKTIFVGGIFIMLGHVALAIPSTSLIPLFTSITLLVIGTGMLKPNVSSTVGSLYSHHDFRRDSGFNIFYTGINLGAFIAPLIVGTLGQKYNFHLGFSLAAFGMFIGLITFVITKKKYLGIVGSHVPNPMSKIEKKNTLFLVSIAVIVIAVIAFIGILTNTLTINLFTIAISILAIILPVIYFVVMYKSKKTSTIEKSNLISYIPLFIAAVIFFAIQEQGSIILATYADTRTQLDMGFINLKSSWFQSFGPIFIVILAPFFAWMWFKLRNHQPGTTYKFSIGLVFAGLSFIIMIIPGLVFGVDTLASPFWLIGSFLLISVGELFLSPIGLSATTKLAPKAFQAQTMSVWFLANAAGQGVNAQIVKLFTPETEILYFTVIGIVAIFLSVVLFFIAPKVEHKMN